jgi:hypothetical protein
MSISSPPRGCLLLGHEPDDRRDSLYWNSSAVQAHEQDRDVKQLIKCTYKQIRNRKRNRTRPKLDYSNLKQFPHASLRLRRKRDASNIPQNITKFQLHASKTLQNEGSNKYDIHSVSKTRSSSDRMWCKMVKQARTIEVKITFH